MRRLALWVGLVLMVSLAPRVGRAVEAPVIEELTVTGERAGPGLWHIQHGAANLWIFGTTSPLPKNMTWRSAQLEALLDHTDQLIVAKPVDLGAARALWLMMTQRSVLLAGKGRRLKDAMPPELYARFAAQRARLKEDDDKWEKYRPIVAAAFLQEAALHKVGLSTRLDLNEEARDLARKHHVKIEEFKIAGWRDVLDSLKNLPPATENACVAASFATLETGLPRLTERARAWATGNVEKIQSLPEPAEVSTCRNAVSVGSGAGDLVQQLKRTWMSTFAMSLQGSSTTVAVVGMDLLIQPGGFLDALRAQGYTIEAP